MSESLAPARWYVSWAGTVTGPPVLVQISYDFLDDDQTAMAPDWLGHRKLAATWLSQPAASYSSSSISSDGVLPPARTSRGGAGALARSWLAKEANTMLFVV